MMDLPGRSTEDDHEASHALRVLFEAEEIKMAEDGITDKVLEQITKKREILDRIESVLSSGDFPGPSKTGLEDFITRLKESKMEEEFKTQETPQARRFRIENRKPKFAGPVLVTKFT